VPAVNMSKVSPSHDSGTGWMTSLWNAFLKYVNHLFSSKKKKKSVKCTLDKFQVGRLGDDPDVQSQ